ncbi:hypothetical protein JXA34_01490 [Patescibacteria group bacterium]|nr:hypothetical protein [Patescibacteria group bacterium]
MSGTKPMQPEGFIPPWELHGSKEEGEARYPEGEVPDIVREIRKQEKYLEGLHISSSLRELLDDKSGKKGYELHPVESGAVEIWKSGYRRTEIIDGKYVLRCVEVDPPSTIGVEYDSNSFTIMVKENGVGSVARDFGVDKIRPTTKLGKLIAVSEQTGVPYTQATRMAMSVYRRTVLYRDGKVSGEIEVKIEDSYAQSVRGEHMEGVMDHTTIKAGPTGEDVSVVTTQEFLPW